MDRLKIQTVTVDSLPQSVGAPDEPLVVMPFIDPVMARRSAVQLAQRAGCAGRLLCIHDVDRLGFVAVANQVFQRCRSPWFAYVAQDAFAGRKWLKAGLTALAREDGGLLAFNDGKWAGVLAAFGMVTCDWARSNYGGDLFFPGYRQHYADAELSVLALQEGKHRFDPLSMLIEVDWEKDASSVNADDKALYGLRASKKFDGLVTKQSLLNLFS